MLGMRLESGIAYGFNMGLFFQPARDLQRVRAVTLHAQRQRFQTTHGQKAVEWPGNCPYRILQKRNLITELLVFAHDNDAADYVGMPIKIFGSGMDHHIETKFDRPLNPWAGKSV